MKEANFLEKINHKFIFYIKIIINIFIFFENYLLKKILLRKEKQNFLYNFIMQNPNYVPSSSIQIVNLLSSRYRNQIDKYGSNRVRPIRWLMINKKIRNLLKKYNIKKNNFLNVGAGNKNPFTLPILWYLDGATKVEIIEPDKINKISAISGIQELFWYLQCNKNNSKSLIHKIQNFDSKINKVLNGVELMQGKELNKIINKKIIKLHNTTVENSFLKDNEYDFIYSRSTLEHVLKIKETLLKLYKLQKPGGIAYHEIDFTGHNNKDMFWIYYYEWEVNKNNLDNLNGWRLSDYMNFYKEIGAKVIVREKVLEEKKLIKVDQINNRFKNYNIDDLRVNSASILVFKN